MEFTSNLIEMVKEPLNHQSDLCEGGVEDSSTDHAI